jgi:hypothetical protein
MAGDPCILLLGLIGTDGFEDLPYLDEKREEHEGVIRTAQTRADSEKQRRQRSVAPLSGGGGRGRRAPSPVARGRCGR